MIMMMMIMVILITTYNYCFYFYCYWCSQYSGQAIKVEGGLRAIQELLKNARFWHNFAYGEKVYFKKGGYKQALKDFKSVVDPKTVRNVNVVSILCRARFTLRKHAHAIYSNISRL